MDGDQTNHHIETLEVSVQVLAQACNIEPRRIQQLVKLGVLPKVRHGKYDLVVCMSNYIRWLQSQLSGGEIRDSHSEKTRLLSAQADKVELELATRRGTLVEIKDIVDTVGREYSFIRAHLLALPAKLAAGLVELSHAEIEERLHSEINETLETLQADQPGDGRKPRRRVKKNTPRRSIAKATPKPV